MIVSGVDDAFPAAIVQVAAQLDADPVDLANVLYSESGIHPSTVNSIGCLGINQFCASSGRENLPGWPGDHAYVQLSASEQLLHFVGPWWGRLKMQHGISGPLTGRDLYWLNFLPGLFVPNAPDSYVITRNASYVADNPGFAQGKSYITAGDISRALVAARSQNPDRWNAIAQAIANAQVQAAPSPAVAILMPGRVGAGGVVLAAGLAALAYYAAGGKFT